MTDSIYRCSNHTLRWNTKTKNTELYNLFRIYKQELERCMCELLELDMIPKMGSVESDIIQHSAWKQIVFVNASEIIRSQLKQASKRRFKTYKKIYFKAKDKNRFHWFTSKKFSELNLKPIHKTRFFKKPELKSVSITVDSRICNIKSDSKHFDGFLKISLPFLKDGSKRYQSIRLPFKHHKHSLKFKDWKQKKSVGLRINEKNIHLTFFYEKEKQELKKSGISLGLDIGYKKLLSLSNGMFYGTKDLEYLYTYISKKQRGSKKYKKKYQI